MPAATFNPIFLATIDAVKVYAVDGDEVKLHYDMDFVEGGNGQRYGWIPDDEIWLDANLAAHEWRFTALHELAERRLMRGGWSYEKAHKAALAVVRVYRVEGGGRERYRKTFVESEHPRDEEGKFSDAEKHDVAYTTKKGEQKTRQQWLMPGGKALPTHLKGKVIPPGWTNVKISSDPNAAVLATGVDAKGRLHRIYSDAHVQRQAQAKFSRVTEGIRKLTTMLQQNAQHLQASDPRTREAAAVWRLIQHTGIRPGSDRDTKAAKQAYGATTLMGQHVTQDENGKVVLRFTGKKGVDLAIPVSDRSIAEDLLRRKSTAGNDGRLFGTNAGALLSYSHGLDGGGFKTKDFRTIRGTMHAQSEVAARPKPTNEKERRLAIRDVANAVSTVLGNTPTIALQSYIDPHVFDLWKLEEAA